MGSGTVLFRVECTASLCLARPGGTLIPLMPGNLSFWVTPLWFVSVGVTLGAAVLVVLFGLLWLISRPTAASVLRTVQESVLQWISYVVLVYVALCLLATPMMPWRSVLDSTRRLPYVGTRQVIVTVPPRTDDFDVDV